MNNISKPKAGEGTTLWLVKIILGGLVIAFLVLHFIVNHLIAPGGLLNYQAVLDYYSNPIIPIIEGLFLIVVIAHCLLGVRSVILDLNPSKRLLKILDIVFVLGGSIAVGYGIWLLVILTART